MHKADSTTRLRVRTDLVRCRICKDALLREKAVPSNVHDVPGPTGSRPVGTVWAWAHAACEASHGQTDVNHG